MRITNRMMTNNMLHNINKNRNNLSTLESQYSSGKKIQRPSEDPMVAVRSLKLRTNLTELNQYYEKNIPDAKSWMNVTESALGTVNGLLTSMHTLLVQGANDTLTTSDRNSVLANLKQLTAQIYQEGNTDYAGRYVFTGYKTDTSLLFDKDTNNLSYEITESFKPTDIEYITKINETSNFNEVDFKNINPEDMTESPGLIHAHRIRLSYNDLSSGPDISSLISISGGNADALEGLGLSTRSLTDGDAYNPPDNTIHFIPETGELILGEEALNALREADGISVTYQKDSFKKDDLRPEHYFDCIKTDLDINDPGNKPIQYIKTDQQIQYEVNFNQKLTVNTQSKDAFSHEILREVQDLILASDDVAVTEARIKEVESYLEDPSFENKAGLERMLETLNVELSLKNKTLQEKFSKGLTTLSDQQERVNIAVSDLGSRFVRLELTESRLSYQQIDFEELLSQNEDADLVDTIIRYGSAETIYNASLAAAGKIVKTSLLDFL